MTTRLGILGFGAIGQTVVKSLLSNDVGLDLIGFADQDLIEDAPIPQETVSSLIKSCDVIVESAGHAAVKEHAVPILESGTDLMIVSVGALADRSLEKKVLSAQPGQLIICTGALAGVDYLQAALNLGGIRKISLTSTKKPKVLIQSWMEEALRQKLERGDCKMTVFKGNARESAEAFPKSTNGAATIALAVGNWETVEVEVVADPEADQTKHVVEIVGDVGRSKFEVANLPSVSNPATSSIVPHAVVKALKNHYGTGLKIL